MASLQEMYPAKWGRGGGKAIQIGGPAWLMLGELLEEQARVRSV